MRRFECTWMLISMAQCTGSRTAKVCFACSKLIFMNKFESPDTPPPGMGIIFARLEIEMEPLLKNFKHKPYNWSAKGFMTGTYRTFTHPGCDLMPFTPACARRGLASLSVLLLRRLLSHGCWIASHLTLLRTGRIALMLLLGWVALLLVCWVALLLLWVVLRRRHAALVHRLPCAYGGMVSHHGMPFLRGAVHRNLYTGNCSKRHYTGSAPEASADFNCYNR